GNPVLDVQGLTQALEEAAQRDRKAAEGLDFAQKRALLLNQEVLILEKAEQQLAQLTGNTAPILAWGDPLPESAHQALVLSFDPEEAGAALHAMPEIDRKRWFDLSPCNTPESLAGLSLAPLEDYRQGGVVVITTAARERIRALAVTLRERLAAAQAILSENSSAREFYEQERVQSQVERENLVRLWVQGVVADWLEEHQAELLDYLAVLRERSERRWFSRGLISRVVVIPSSQDTGEVLLSACRQVLPALSRDQSRIMPYEYRPEPKLPSDQREALLLKARETRQPAPVLRNTLDQSLRMINRERLLEYLDNLTGELRVTRTDLLVIEQPLELAGATLEHLRQALPHLSQIPAIVILPEAWSPEPNEGLPWPRTRVMLLRRLGSFSIEDASSRLLTLFTP
ncbi:MAG: hypothetical protein OEW39_08830, partial [Deltaproteobacteria bacterium]|nr:hypothetical protein [Deltaproteobacteria bacterium]